MALRFLHNGHLLTLTICALLVAGFSAVLTLPRQEDPRLSNWFGIVTVPFPGASAERVESLITDPLEQHLREVSELSLVESRSARGVAVVVLEIDNTILETDRVWSRVRDKLDDVRSEFPPGAAAPDLDHERTETAFTAIYSIAAPEGIETDLPILKRWADELADRLRNVGGTDLVRVFGAPEEEITVVADPEELVGLGLTVAELGRQIANTDVKSAAGTLRSSVRESTIELSGDLNSEERIRRIPVTVQGADSGLRVGSIATVERGFRTPQATLGWSAGRRALFVATRMDEDRQVDRWFAKTAVTVEELKEETAGSLAVDLVFDQSSYTSARLDGLVGNLLLGAGIVLAVLFVLMGWRAALLVGLALPLTSAAVLFVLRVLEIPLHQMSITGLIIALGLLIDNAIVVVDEVTQRLRKDPTDRVGAIRETLSHLFVPLLGSTLTTVLAFMPILLLTGAVGQFVGTIAISVILAISASFAISMLLLPALTARLGASEGVHWWNRGLHSKRWSALSRSAVRWVTRNPLLGLLLVAACPS